MKKKFLSIAVVAVVMTVMLAVTAFAAVTVEVTGDLFDGGTTKNTAKLTLTGIPDDAEELVIDWSSSSENITLNEKTGKEITVTADAGGEGSARVMVYYSYKPKATEEVPEPETVSDTITTTLTIHKYALDSIEATCSRDYVKGQDIEKNDIKVKATFTDGSKDDNYSSFDYSPKTANTDGETITVTAGGKQDTFTISVSTISPKDLVKSFSIAYPTSSTEFNVGGYLKKDDVEIRLTYLDDTTSTVSLDNKDVSYSGIAFTNGKYTFSSDDAKTAPVLEVTYADFPKQSVALKVTEKTPEKTLSGLKVTASATAKTEYYVGESFSATGYTFTAEYSNGTSKNVTTSLKYSPSSFTTTGSSIPVTITYTEGGVSKTETVYVKVSDKVDVTGFSTSSSYKSVLDEDAKVKLGDELDWEELFEYVYIKYTNSKNKTAYEKISDNDDLEDWLGDDAKLYVIVSGKTGNDEDVVEEDDIDDGEVTLKLYLEYAGKTYSSSSFDVEVSDVSCTVTVYRSSTSSTKIGDSKVFDDLKEALEYLEDKDDIIDDFGISSSYKNSFVIKIKLGEDQSLSSFEFAPDHEQDIIIDLNGCELRLKSEWIDYEDCEDITIVITNTNEDEYGTLTYNDLSTSLVVAEDSELEFTEGEIPMDSDAACMVTIYRSSSSSTVLGTKVYNTLKEALTALEEQEEVIEDYDISSSYEDTFVVKIKLGEDQNLSATTFTFTPDYDTTITIDCNGYTLRLRSEWIDYDDCEDLVVYVTNTNDDEDATMTYSDLSSSLTISEGDSLKFEEDEIPGIYDVTISSTTNGRITASKTTAAHGGTVTFTITPNSGYAISTVRVGTKSITTSTEGYTVNSNTGVGTYRMEDITADVTISATFKVSSTSSSSSSSSSSAADWTNPFTDVTKNAQYYDAVAFVCSEGLFNGMTATKFEPMTTMTRAMFVTVLGRLADIDVSKYSGTSFTDVSKTDQQISWATPYIEWAVQNGITQGTGNGKFSPNDPITHQQMYLFMYRYAMFVENITTPLTGVSLTSIRDAGEIADWAEEGVKFASKNGILITSGGKLTPADNALRCELAMLLEGFCTKVLGYND